MENMTAKMSCFARAYHCRTSRCPVFADTAAAALLGADYEKIARSLTEGSAFFLPGFRGTPEEGLRLITERQLAPSVLARSAFCEEMLARERAKGCGQYLLFGAGYDTFGARHTDTGLRVFELDRPGLFADKQARLEAAGLRSAAAPVVCDLARDDWQSALAERGFRKEEKALAGLLGLCYYLPEEAFRALMKALAALTAAGSCVCFDYPTAEESGTAAVNRALAAGAGEKMRARYSREEMEKLLTACGFSVAEHLDAGQMTVRYFAEHNRAEPEHTMAAPEGVAYVLAVRR